jgi:hypothetical protein
MERMTFRARPTGMTNQGRVRGLATAGLLCAGLLCAALAGCGTAVVSATAASTPRTPEAGAAQTPGAGAPLAAAAAEVGCASVNQATSVTVARSVVAVEGINPGALRVTQRTATKVRALFGDFCAVLAHAGTPHREFECAAGFGNSYAGTFYDGQRVLATFGYSLRGCPRLSLTVSGKTRVTLVVGNVASAAPHLKADLAAVLGVPVSHL